MASYYQPVFTTSGQRGKRIAWRIRQGPSLARRIVRAARRAVRAIPADALALASAIVGVSAAMIRFAGM